MNGSRTTQPGSLLPVRHAALWIVSIGRWHFGPFEHNAAQDFANTHSGKVWPLWVNADDVDALSGRKAVDIALEEATRA